MHGDTLGRVGRETKGEDLRVAVASFRFQLAVGARMLYVHWAGDEDGSGETKEGAVSTRDLAASTQEISLHTVFITEAREVPAMDVVMYTEPSPAQGFGPVRSRSGKYVIGLWKTKKGVVSSRKRKRKFGWVLLFL